MKIIALEVQSTRIPTVRAHQMAIGTTNFQENTVVKLFADDGTIGYGEAPHMVGHSQLGETPATVRVILRHKLAPAVLGQNPMNQEALAQALDRAVPGNGRAKGAVIMAAYDLAGKALNTPVYNLLGGKVRDAVPLSWSLPIVDAKTAAAEGVQMVERGWRILKVKIGRPDPYDDARVVQAVREAVGDSIGLRADANQAYNRKTALAVLRRMEPCNLDFVEQPVHRDDLQGMALITRESGIPIMADESAKSMEALGDIIRQDAADAISIYIIGPGGLHNSKKMAALCQAFRLRAYVGGALESIIGASAGLHLAASSPAIDLGCEMSSQYLLKDDIGTRALEMRDGALVVPDGPGFGFEIDEDKLAHYREGEVERFALQEKAIA
jgi:muconate/chloromuconate cycloisomerase